MGKSDTVKCRFSKCKCLHESDVIPKSEAVRDGRLYYHPDCFHVKGIANDIKKIFCEEINPLITAEQVKQLYSVVYNIILTKKVDPDFLKFAVEYFARYKKGALKYPGGINYIIQDKEVTSKWAQFNRTKVAKEIRKEQNEILDDEDYSFDLPDTTEFKANNQSKFSSIMG